MKIVRFTKKHLNEMAQLFKESYSEPGNVWDIQTAKRALKIHLTYFSRYNFVAINEEDTCMGGIFNLVNPDGKGKALFINSLQVKKQFRKQGIAKALLKKTLDHAKKEKINTVGLLTKEKSPFPFAWYKKLGFKKTGYIEYAADVKKIKL